MLNQIVADSGTATESRSVRFGISPELAGLGASASGIEHGRRRLVGEDFRRGADMLQKPFVHGPQMPGGVPDPVGKRRTVEVDPLPGVDLRLTIERQMIGVFGNEHMRDGRFGRQAALDQTRRSRRLRDAFLAGAASVFWPPRHQHAELRWNDIEPFGDVLADPVKLALAARAGLVVDIDDGFDARQMGGQRAAIAPAPARGFGAGRRGFAFRAAASPASVCSTSSSASSIWSSGSVSARRPKRWRCISLMI